jgi:hypothetical protein
LFCISTQVQCWDQSSWYYYYYYRHDESFVRRLHGFNFPCEHYMFSYFEFERCSFCISMCREKDVDAISLFFFPVVVCAWSPVLIWPVVSDFLTPIHVNIKDSSPRRFLTLKYTHPYSSVLVIICCSNKDKNSVCHNQGLFILYMGYLFTRFDPKEPSAGNTYIRVTKNNYWFISGLYVN